MTVWDVVGTGFEGGFVALGEKRVGASLDIVEEQQRVERVWQVLSDWWMYSRPGQNGDEAQVREFSQKIFAELSMGDQSVVSFSPIFVGYSD